MDGGKLWPLMVDVLLSACDPSNSATKTIEDAASEVLSRGAVRLSSEETTLLLDCVVGASRFLAVCDGALQGYCDYLKRNKVDRQSMHLIAYVVLFKHRELGPETMRQLFQKSTSRPRLVEYLSYLADDAAVATHSTPLWLQSYDISFVSGTLLPALRRAAPALRKLIDSLSAAATAPHAAAVPAVTQAADEMAVVPSALSDGAGDSSETPVLPPTTSKKAVTLVSPSPPPPPPAPTAVADNVTKTTAAHGVGRGKRVGRSKKLPPAEVREMAFTIAEPRHPPVKRQDGGSPAAARGSPSTAAAEGGAAPAPAKPLSQKSVGFQFSSCAFTEAGDDRKPTNSASEPPFAAKDYSRVRRILDTPVEVPMTNAALRREAHTHQQRRAEEERVLQELEINQHDERAFEQWRRSELAKDERQRELLLLERHLAALQSDESVRAARAEGERTRRKVCQSMKRDAVVESQERRREEENALALQRQFVVRFREELARSRREAEERFLQEKLHSAEVVKVESEEARRAIRVAEEQRKTEQAVVIQEIRLLRERVRVKQEELLEQRRNVGSVESDNDDDVLLSALTTAQLREELELVKARDRALEEERRRRIVAAKEREAADRAALESLCREQRQKCHRDRERLRESKDTKAATIRAAQLAAETERMVILQQRLKEKRQQRKAGHQKTREAERQRRNDANMRAADDTAMEKERWRQLEHGIINRISASQAAVADKGL